MCAVGQEAISPSAHKTVTWMREVLAVGVTGLVCRRIYLLDQVFRIKGVVADR